MIGFVIVSHSAQIAEGVCELAAQVAQGKVRLAPAGGTGDAANPLGTDAMRVLGAIEAVYSEDGVIVLTDLGSAVLSAETALEFLDETRRTHVHLYDAPLVEGAVAAVTLAAAGATIEEILRPAAARAPGGPGEEQTVRVVNPLGLHARPSAQLVRMARRFTSRLTIENLTVPAGPADATSINGLLGLAARQGHELRLRAYGGDALQAMAAAAGLFADGFGERETRSTAAPPAASGGASLRGLPGAAGIAVGPLVRLRVAVPEVEARTVEDVEAEARRLEQAVAAARAETRALFDWARAHAGANEAGIFDAQLLFLEDAALIEAALAAIRGRRWNAEFAWQTVAGDAARRLGAVEADLADVARRVVRALTGAGAAMPRLDMPAVVAARDVTPAEVHALGAEKLLGLCLETGSASAHSVILARAMGIPVVVGLGTALGSLADGTTVALDGARGLLWVSPDEAQARDLEARRDAWAAGVRAARQERYRPARTRDGRPVRVLANIGGVEDAAAAVEAGAEGVGVLRTEFLFLGRAEAPGEEEQYRAYRAVAEALGGRLLVVRTLDAGGDKQLPYLDIGAEANPFLGWRGIRLTLAARALLETQLRAILRAGAGHRVEVLFPMISTIEELRQAKAVVAEVELQLEGEGQAFHQATRAGAMIEVPSAVAAAPQLAREAAFFSIGTNDLVQYMMAADRTNARVAALADPFQPAVLRALRQSIEAARAASIGVTLCGELAADTLATPLLIGLGLDEFSVSAPLVAGLKHAIAAVDAARAEDLAARALELDSAAAVRRLLEEHAPAL